MNTHLQWFCEDIGDSTNDVSKYKADLYYYKKEYKTALHLYEQLLQVLPTTHSQVGIPVMYMCILDLCY